MLEVFFGGVEGLLLAKGGLVSLMPLNVAQPLLGDNVYSTSAWRETSKNFLQVGACL